MFTVLDRFPVAQDNLQFHERTEVVNPIKVNSGPPNQEDFPPLQDDAAKRQDCSKCFRKNPCVLTVLSGVHRFFRATLVWSLIRDELARTVRKLADLETTAGNREEGIGLLQNLAWTRCQRSRSRSDRVELTNRSLDLDISGHASTRLRETV
jgi:hypothetical protein